MDLFSECRLIVGKVVCELVDFDHHHRRKAESDGHRHTNCTEDRQGPGQFQALECPDQWGQDKAQENGKRDRDENFTRKIEGGNDNRAGQKI